MDKYFPIILGLLLLSPLSITVVAGADSVEEQFISMAVQGDLRQAESLFAAMDPVSTPIKDFDLARQYRARFILRSGNSSPDSGDPEVDTLVEAYQHYWADVLMGRLSPRQGENSLARTLAARLNRADPALRADPANVFELLGPFLDQRGFHHLHTPAPPLLDLFLWNKEYTRSYRVKLTDRSRQVRVTFMSDMVSKGWKEYASLGLASTTGWVDEGSLYCVEWAYDRASERFTVSFLKHESRHLADLERYPGMSSEQLEYRAKLTELAFASATLGSLLEDFTAKSAENPDSPHAQANFRVTRNLYQALHGTPYPETELAWQGLSTQSVNRAARKLLEQDTTAAGANRE